jgi:hypothetical protein
VRQCFNSRSLDITRQRHAFVPSIDEQPPLRLDAVGGVFEVEIDRRRDAAMASASVVLPTWRGPRRATAAWS